MSERMAFGASHDTHGSRKNVLGEAIWLLIALRMSCWRWTRVKSFSPGKHGLLADAGHAERLLAVEVVLAGWRLSVWPPFLRPPLISARSCGGR